MLAVALLAFALALRAPQASAEVEPGPFTYTSQSLLHVVLFDFRHEAPRFDEPGQWRLILAGDWANIWGYTPNVARIDGESLVLRPILRFTYAPGLDAAIEWPLQYMGGGVLDRIAENVHRLLRIGNASRDEFPRNQLRIERYNTDGTAAVILDDRAAGWRRRAPTVSLRARLTPAAWNWPVALKVATNLPQLEADNGLIDSRGHDWGVGLSIAGQLPERHRLTVSVAREALRNAKVRQELELRKARTSAAISVQRAISERRAFIAQVVRESALTRHTGTGLDQPSTSLLLGARRRLDNGASLEFALIEDLFIHDNNVDFGFHVTYSLPTF